MNLDDAKALLEQSGRYRILEKYQYQKVYAKNSNNEPTKIACILDTETTDVDPEVAEVFNIGLVTASYGAYTGQIYSIIELYDGFNDTTKPLTQEIQDLTGITPDMIKGQKFDNDKITKILTESDIIVAHHAKFDRGMVDPRWKISQSKIWFDSCGQIPWKSLGALGARLSDAATLFGYYFDGHRAINDSLMLLHILAQKHNNVPMLQLMLQIGSQEYVNVVARNAPFGANGALRNGQYKWNKDQKLWIKRVPVTEVKIEENYLNTFVYAGNGGFDVIPIPRVDLFKP